MAEFGVESVIRDPQPPARPGVDAAAWARDPTVRPCATLFVIVKTHTQWASIVKKAALCVGSRVSRRRWGPFR